MRSLFAYLILAVISTLNFSCHGGSATTVVIIEEQPPVIRQNYKIHITEISAFAPVGGANALYVTVSNYYNTTPIAVTTGNDVSLFDYTDNKPITFQLRDDAGVIFEHTEVLTDPLFLGPDVFQFIDGNDNRNSISFTTTLN